MQLVSLQIIYQMNRLVYKMWENSGTCPNQILQKSMSLNVLLCQSKNEFTLILYQTEKAGNPYISNTETAF